MSRRLFGQFFTACVAVALGSLVFVGVYAARSIGAIHRDALRADLEARAWMLSSMAPADRLEEAAAELDRLCKTLGAQTDARLTIALRDGRVLGETMEEPLRMDPHHTRPEIAEALTGGVGAELRYSATVGERMLYVAVPIRGADGGVLGAARVAVPLSAVREQRSALRRRLLAGGLAAALLAAVLSYFVSGRIVRPIEHMRRAAERFAEGDLDARLYVEGPEEVGRLAESLNRMAADLRTRIDAVVEQRNEREAVLAAMTEGVFTVGADGRVRDCNAAAARLLNTTPDAARGRPLAEVARNTTLQDLVNTVVHRALAGECDLVFRGPQERYVQVRGVPLALNGKDACGALVVMADVTRLKRLENVRREFVANVSHELKTPITSIRAACETLIDENPKIEADRRRFLDMIHRQAARLESIVEDLLSLSRIEHDVERDAIRRERAPVRPALEAAAAHCGLKARARGVRLRLDCPDNTVGRFNPALIEQAVANLIDNAIKFSPEKGEIMIACTGEKDRIQLRVADQGPGIEPEHQARIFERFYCVDSGRSRKLGGTGLGLAIVKHIAVAHGGVVRVESTPGQGSVFILDLPGAAEEGTPPVAGA